MSKKLRDRACKAIALAGALFIEEPGVPESLGRKFSKKLAFGEVLIYVCENRFFIKFSDIEYGVTLTNLVGCGPCNSFSGKLVLWVDSKTAKSDIDYAVKVIEKIFEADSKPSA